MILLTLDFYQTSVYNFSENQFSMLFHAICIFINYSISFFKILKEFIKRDLFLFREYYEKKAQFEQGESWIKGNETQLADAKKQIIERQSQLAQCMDFFAYNASCVETITQEAKERLIQYNLRLNANFTSMDELMNHLGKVLEDKKQFLESKRDLIIKGKEKVEQINDMVWTLINTLFVIGGMIGAFTSKYVLDYLGRKNGIILNGLFSVAGSLLVFIVPFIRSPICIMISRFMFGIQGGMACSLVYGSFILFIINLKIMIF
jgi:hypothetical protein